ncbi:hypothetical protein SAMN05444172_9303 [Burkholderia sp. GAS332]|nr:hypothetical protein SAMN05444172_9303 [Burkholderia sp. GAS332]
MRKCAWNRISLRSRAVSARWNHRRMAVPFVIRHTSPGWLSLVDGSVDTRRCDPGENKIRDAPRPDVKEKAFQVTQPLGWITPIATLAYLTKQQLSRFDQPRDGTPSRHKHSFHRVTAERIPARTVIRISIDLHGTFEFPKRKSRPVDRAAFVKWLYASRDVRDGRNRHTVGRRKRDVTPCGSDILQLCAFALRLLRALGSGADGAS